MASIVKETVIDAPAAACWDALRDFGAIHERLTTGFVTGATMAGERERQVTFFTGAVAREKLVGIDDELMRLAYTVTESALGSTHCNASAQITPLGDRQCRFTWIIDVLPDELGGRIEQLMDGGLTAIKKTLEG
jgi:Polyketide cyclase / dehydrase and lipid transport